MEAIPQPSEVLGLFSAGNPLSSPAVLLAYSVATVNTSCQAPLCGWPRSVDWTVVNLFAMPSADKPTSGAQAHHVPRLLGLPGLTQQSELESWVSLAQCCQGICISLHHELARLLRQGWDWTGALQEVRCRIQALPISSLALIEVGGFTHWPPDSGCGDAPNQRVPEELWELVRELSATGHIPALRLAWQDDVPPLAVLLDEVHRAHQALADA